MVRQKKCVSYKVSPHLRRFPDQLNEFPKRPSCKKNIVAEKCSINLFVSQPDDSAGQHSLPQDLRAPQLHSLSPEASHLFNLSSSLFPSRFPFFIKFKNYSSIVNSAESHDRPSNVRFPSYFYKYVSEIALAFTDPSLI